MTTCHCLRRFEILKNGWSWIVGASCHFSLLLRLVAKMTENYAKIANPNVPLTKMEGEEQMTRGTSQWVLLEEESFFARDLPLRTKSPMAQCEKGEEKSQKKHWEVHLCPRKPAEQCDFESEK